MSLYGSSFSSVSDLESAINDTRLEEALKELEKVKVENAELKRLVQELKDKVKESTAEPEVKLSFRCSNYVFNLQESILTSIVGSWSIVSSIGMEEYLEKSKLSDLHDAIFRVATQNIEIEEDIVTIDYAIGARKHWKSRMVLGKKSGKTLLFVEDNVLVTVYFRDDGDEFSRVERFVKDGQLHVVSKRFGMNCIRIYEKVGSEKKTDTEAAKRIAELESELETLREEKAQYAHEELKKKTMKYIEEMESLVEELSSKCLSNFADLKKAISIEEDDNEIMKKENKEMKSDEKSLTDKNTDEPIETAIVGRWKLKSSLSGMFADCIVDLSMESGQLRKTTTYLSYQANSVWELNNPTYDYYGSYAHTFIKNNHIITNSIAKSGCVWFSIDRKVEGNLLTETTTNMGRSVNVILYERII